MGPLPYWRKTPLKSALKSALAQLPCLAPILPLSFPRLKKHIPDAQRKPQTSVQPHAKQAGAGAFAPFKSLLAAPVSGASLAIFRIALGVVMSLEAFDLLRPNRAAISSGLTPLETYYTGADIHFHFPYPAFEWLPLLPAHWIHGLVWIQAIAGIMMAIGFCYRASAVAVFLAWGYLWVVESTRTYWQSHYYLETLLTFLMIWMPAARRYSLDAWLARGQDLPRTVPFWSIFLLRGQLLIAYFYAGVAKLNIDWIRDAMPVRWFLAQAHVTAPFERYLTAGQFAWLKSVVQSPEFAFFISHTGLVFDLAVGFLLLIRRTRIFALVLMVIFHSINHLLIFDDIGWFPLVGILTALIFLDPDWPERFGQWLRRPRLGRPDWKWFVPGAIIFPVVGAALGWKLKPTQPRVATAAQQLGRFILPFIVIWLAWQALMPVRHYFIPGDGRFTYEGLSLSWRLKSEARRAFAAQLFVTDTAIISRDSAGHTRINWNEWHGDKVIYRRVLPGSINWPTMPEIMIVLIPGIGEQVVYNPFVANTRTEADSQQRVNRIWLELYGRSPRALYPSDDPFLLQDQPQPGAFLVIEDPQLLAERPDGLSQLNRQAWKHSPYTRGQRASSDAHVGAEPLVIHIGNVGPAIRNVLPQACVFDSQDQPEQPAYIWWNSLKDLSVSKFLHTSYQAFYLRRYARRVADLWLKEYGRRPAVHATTAVSLNGRPHQHLVDPAADLATVPVTLLGHNQWIRQLETPRIPRDALVTPPTL
jgi:hypothetical protein